MEFKKLEIQEEGSWLKRKLWNPHARKTILYMLIGAVGGFSFFYLSVGKQLDVITFDDIIKSSLTGAFFGYFITNSPCARGRC